MGLKTKWNWTSPGRENQLTTPISRASMVHLGTSALMPIGSFPWKMRKKNSIFGGRITTVLDRIARWETCLPTNTLK